MHQAFSKNFVFLLLQRRRSTTWKAGVTQKENKREKDKFRKTAKGKQAASGKHARALSNQKNTESTENYEANCIKTDRKKSNWYFPVDRSSLISKISPKHFSVRSLFL